jgi:hypothetical protein
MWPYDGQVALPRPFSVVTDLPQMGEICNEILLIAL